MEVKGLLGGEGQIVAQGETPPGISFELCLNALPDGLACGLEGERLAIEGDGNVAGQAATGGSGVCWLRDKQGRCDRLVFLIVQTVGGFDLQGQRAAVNGCDANVQGVGKQNQG